MRKKSGFTLIELLVVISVIALLTSIVLASLQSARSKAKLAAGLTFSSHLNSVYTVNAAGIWDMDESTGTSVYDKSGNNNTGTIGGSGSFFWTTGIHNTGINLNGDSITVPTAGTSAFDSPVFTIAFWIKPNSINPGDANNNIIFGRENYLNSGFRMGITGNAVSFWTGQSGGSIALGTFLSTIPIGTDQFYHVAVTYDSTQKATIYINGAMAGSISGTYVVPKGIPLGINGGTGGVTFSNSVFDEVRYYTQSLTAMEVEHLYASEAPYHKYAAR